MSLLVISFNLLKSLATGVILLLVINLPVSASVSYTAEAGVNKEQCSGNGYSFLMDIKSDVISGNGFKLTYDAADSALAKSAGAILDSMITFYKQAGTQFYYDQAHIFNIVLCHDNNVFNSVKHSGTPDFETSCFAGNILYLVQPSTSAQNAYFSSFQQAVRHGFAKHFIDFNFAYSMPEWLRYGFARFEAGMLPSVSYMRSQFQSLGRKPGMSEMNNWGAVYQFDKYAFAATMAQFIVFKFGYHDLNRYSVSLSGSSVKYGFWSISDEAGFEKTWYKFMDIFYFNNDQTVVKLQKETEHFKIYLCESDKQFLPQFEALLEQTVKLYMDQMAVSLNHRISMVVYPSLCEYHNSVNVDVCNPGSIGGGLGIGFLQIVTPRDIGGWNKCTVLLQHELAHVIQFHVNPTFMPAWLSEGYATYMPFLGALNDQSRRNLMGDVNHKMELAKAKLGRYPTISEMEDYNFVGSKGIDYYTIGMVMNEFIIRQSGYAAIKKIITSTGKDFSGAGFSTKQDFENAFYKYYDTAWKATPKNITAKKTLYAPVIDGKLNESYWELSNKADRKFWITGGAANSLRIDNDVTFGLMWDDKNLYIAVKVIDKNLVNSGSYDWYDGIEIQIDGNNSRGTAFDNTSDIRCIWNYGWTEPYLPAGANKGVNLKYSAITDGYTVEMSVPFTALGLTPSAGASAAFDLINIDEDAISPDSHGQFIFSGHTSNQNILNGLANLTLSPEIIKVTKVCKVNSPAPASVHITGNIIPISWSSDFVENLQILATTDNEKSWKTITYSYPAIKGSYEWTAPDIVSDKCKFKIIDVSDPSVLSKTDSVFTITRVKLTAPNGGESFAAESKQTVNWSAPYLSRVKIAISYNQGINWNLINEGIEASAGKYEFTVPKINSEKCLIMVASESPASADTSDLFFTITTPTSASDLEIPSDYTLRQNYPNPFNPSTFIVYNLAEASDVKLAVYDLSGREVSCLVNSYQKAGTYSVKFERQGLPSGVYLYKIKAGNYTEVRKMNLLK